MKLAIYLLNQLIKQSRINRIPCEKIGVVGGELSTGDGEPTAAETAGDLVKRES